MLRKSVALVSLALTFLSVDARADGETVILPIPARAQAPEAPPAGWCGETAIQEGLLYFGTSISQQAINRAGRPVHPDLYATEIPGALAALGMRFTTYRGPRGYEPFARWVREALDAGEPVLAGVKLLPTAHPTWGLDHFVLVVGYGPKGLLVNTTWGYRAWVADGDTGISLKGAFYGLRLRGFTAPRRALSARTRAPRRRWRRSTRARTTRRRSPRRAHD